jgi:hypothetical protein
MVVRSPSREQLWGALELPSKDQLWSGVAVRANPYHDAGGLFTSKQHVGAASPAMQKHGWAGAAGAGKMAEWPSAGATASPTEWEDRKLSQHGFLVDTEKAPPWARRARDGYVVDDDATLARNQALRAGKDVKELSPQDQRIVKGMDKLCTKYQVDQDGMMYRGAALRPDQISRFQPGSTFSDRAFMSVAGQRQTAQSYGQARVTAGTQLVMFELRVPAGTRIGRMDDFPGGESVFARNTNWSVAKIEGLTVTLELGNA